MLFLMIPKTTETRRRKLPSQQELQKSYGKKVPDVIGPGLRVLFCGINPSLLSAYQGHHFARPGNRFWPTLHRSGFTERLYRPEEDRQLLEVGLGITNIVDQATARADELSTEQVLKGARQLEKKVLRYRPECLAVLGISAYRLGFNHPRARIGEQEIRFGETRVWILPNPSGLNANYQLSDLANIFAEMREKLKSNT